MDHLLSRRLSYAYEGKTWKLDFRETKSEVCIDNDTVFPPKMYLVLRNQ